MSPSSTLRSGSCLCKSIKYETIGDPIRFAICHCMNCKKATGSAFMSNIFFSKEKVRVLGGEEHLTFYRDTDTASGFPLDRYFCINCGSNVFLQSSQPRGKTIRIVTLGSLDNPTDWVPKVEVWPEHRQHWIKGIDLQKKFAKL